MFLKYMQYIQTCGTLTYSTTYSIRLKNNKLAEHCRPVQQFTSQRYLSVGREKVPCTNPGTSHQCMKLWEERFPKKTVNNGFYELYHHPLLVCRSGQGRQPFGNFTKPLQ